MPGKISPDLQLGTSVT